MCDSDYDWDMDVDPGWVTGEPPITEEEEYIDPTVEPPPEENY